MRKRQSKSKLSSSAEDGSFPILSQTSSSSPRTELKPQKKISKLGCALKALKCSSRALKMDNEPQIFNQATETSFPSQESDWSPPFVGVDDDADDFNPTYEQFQIPTRDSPMHEQQQQQQNDDDDELTRLYKLPKPTAASPANTEEDDSCDSYEKVSIDVVRIASEDTHDTPQVSNIDPNKPVEPTPCPDETKRRMDEMCQKYFNTPKVIHSGASLGDSITPLGSPVEGEDPVRSEVRPMDAKETRKILQFPAMNTTTTTTTSTSIQDSSTIQQKPDNFTFTKEKSTNSNNSSPQVPKNEGQKTGLNLNPDNASMRIGGQEVKAAQSKPGSRSTNVQKSQVEQPAYEMLNIDSFSSISTFAEVSQASKRGKPPAGPKLSKTIESSQKLLTPHPFFWRSHPKHTVTSYNNHSYQPDNHYVRNVVPKIDELRSADFVSECSTEFGPNIIDGIREHEIGDGGDDYAPYLHPAVVRKLWMDSKPIQLKVNSNWHSKSSSDRHPQGPPSTRSRALVESFTTSFAQLPRVFSRHESPRTSFQA